MIIPLASHIEQMVKVGSRPAGRRRERPEWVGMPATGQVLEDREQVDLETVRGRTPGLGQFGEPAFDIAADHHLVRPDARHLVGLGDHVVNLPAHPVQDLAGISAASNTDSARPMPPFPQPPTNLRGTAGDSQVKLTWSASPTSNVLYDVYQRDASLNGWWEKLPYPVSGTSLTARYLANGHVYNFKIAAINVAGESNPSNIISVMPRWADGTAASASVTSSWIFNDYQGFDPIQRDAPSLSACPGPSLRNRPTQRAASRSIDTGEDDAPKLLA
ncbi:fibronectin type III domain-containing protein [Micromonospora sp. DR5-3]|uniref:fibronectin type III domain-containing protein n=1 Tax=unclassified Micromonospora TaxID=2617518 RepID=UPI0011D30711|nr:MULTISPECIES: fibronectin type III domain-containing protein [unclassified Micromonospora]MCW3817905.1 fibronectin type III domain-containing protein [Micromonospora sp. DR5-3]TYC22934.1 fibronectin type III domain-containing protein [Micromonospora sp. MP36]